MGVSTSFLVSMPALVCLLVDTSTCQDRRVDLLSNERCGNVWFKSIVICWVISNSMIFSTLFSHMGVSINGAPTKWLVYRGESHLDMDDLEVIIHL